MKPALFSIFLLIVITVPVILYVNRPAQPQIISPVARTQNQFPSETQAVTRTDDLSGLDTIIKGYRDIINGTYSVAVIDLSEGTEYYFDEEREYEAASLYKLWVMAAAFDQINRGQLSKNQTLSGSVEELNRKFDIASDEAELTEGTITMTVNDAIMKMITISHNYAALLLSEKIGLSRISAFMRSIGLDGSALGTPPMTNAKSTAEFFRKLYSGELADSDDTSEMLEILKLQEINRKLPKYLPQGTVVAHKTGELGTFSHDAGIVYTAKGNYIVVILTDTQDPQTTDDQMARMSLDIYHYMNK